MGTPTIHAAESFFYRLSAFSQRFGAKDTFCKSLDVAMHKVFHTSVYSVVWLDIRSLADLAPPNPAFTFRFLTADEAARYVDEGTYFLDPKMPDRVRSGDEVCFAALAGDRLAAVGCYSLRYNGPEQASGVAMSYPPDVAYMSYGFTHPDYRGARLHGLIMGLALQELAKRGVTKIVSLVSWSNAASLKSCHRLGYTCLGRMFTIGGRKHAIGLYPKAAKQQGVRFGRRALKRG